MTTGPTAEPRENGGPEGKRTGIFLGRPWRPYARVVFMRNALPPEIRPEGWNNWGKEANEKTAWFAEFANTGPGAATSSRASWAHQLNAKEARQFEPKTFLAGSDHWNPIAAAAKLP